MNTYNADKQTRFFLTAGLSFVNLILISLSVVIPSFIPLIMALCIDAAVIFYNTNNYKTIQVSITDDFVEVKEMNIMKKINLEKYTFEKMDFVYRNRPVEWVGRNSVRKGNILTVFIDGHIIFELEPDIDGWRDKMILDMASDLKNRGVKQVVDKYGEKDVML